MRFGCLLVTYTPAKQKLRLIQKLDKCDFDFYTHFDKKIGINSIAERLHAYSFINCAVDEFYDF
jgi:hypothetical protein